MAAPILPLLLLGSSNVVLGADVPGAWTEEEAV
jgi:hypothetical protein